MSTKIEFLDFLGGGSRGVEVTSRLRFETTEHATQFIDLLVAFLKQTAPEQKVQGRDDLCSPEQPSAQSPGGNGHPDGATGDTKSVAENEAPANPVSVEGT